MEQNDAALEQPTTQEGVAETTLGDGSELESDCPSAGDETLQQPNTVAQGEWWGRSTRQLLATKRWKLLLSFFQPPSKTKDLVQGNPHSHGMRKKGAGTLKVVPRRKRAWEDSNLITKRGSRHG